MTDVQFATISSIYTLGGLLGALSAGPLSSKRGRMFALRVSTAFHILGALLEATAPSIPLMAIGRLLSGVGSGAALVVGPIYISEIAPSGARGVLGACTQIMTNTGILISQVLGYFLSYDSMWRIILGVAGILGLLQLSFLVFACESPEWLGTNGKVDAARKALRMIRGNTIDADEISKWTIQGEENGIQHDLLGGDRLLTNMQTKIKDFLRHHRVLHLAPTLSSRLRLLASCLLSSILIIGEQSLQYWV